MAGQTASGKAAPSSNMREQSRGLRIQERGSHSLWLGRTLLIANPASRSGLGAQGAQAMTRELERLGYETCRPTCALTQGPGDGMTLAAGSAPYDTVLALGGDGLIHEVVNGLMQIPADDRPALGLLPLGSGNDYARTWGYQKNDPSEALVQILHGTSRMVDLGHVEADGADRAQADATGTPHGNATSGQSGTAMGSPAPDSSGSLTSSSSCYFMQTLSFGLDAAVALDTMEHRSRGRGAHLFASSGIKVFATSSAGYRFRGTVDGRPVAGDEAVFAVQVGPTYGGGFRICPDASPLDGKLDLCYSTTLPSKPVTLGVFCRARFGLHTSSRYLHFDRCSELELTFAQEPPCQADGERVRGTHFRICSVPAALKLIVPLREND